MNSSLPLRMLAAHRESSANAGEGLSMRTAHLLTRISTMEPFIKGSFTGSMDPTVIAEQNPEGRSPDISS
jgi:hypothetical protein